MSQKDSSKPISILTLNLPSLIFRFSNTKITLLKLKVSQRAILILQVNLTLNQIVTSGDSKGLNLRSRCRSLTT